MNELTVNESAHFRRGDLQCCRGPKEHRDNAGGRYHWVAQWPPWFLRCDDINLNEMKLMKVRSFSFVAFDWSNSARFLLFLENLILRLWSLFEFDRQLFILSYFHAVYHYHVHVLLYIRRHHSTHLKSGNDRSKRQRHNDPKTLISDGVLRLRSSSRDRRNKGSRDVPLWSCSRSQRSYMFFSVCVCFGCSCERRNERPKYVISPWNPSERKNSCLSH